MEAKESFMINRKTLENIIAGSISVAFAISAYALNIENKDKIAHIAKGYVFASICDYVSKSRLNSFTISMAQPVIWEISQKIGQWGVYDYDDMISDAIGIISNLGVNSLRTDIRL